MVFSAFTALAAVSCGGGAPATPPSPLLIITSSSLPGGILGRDYKAVMATDGAMGSVTWGLASGNLPDGLNLSPDTGQITGTPGTIGSSDFTVRATDSNSPPRTATKTFTLLVSGVLQIVDAPIPTGLVGSFYSVQLEATGGAQPLTWMRSDSSDPLPVGVTLNPGTGEISGTPSESGHFRIRVLVQDSTEPPQWDENIYFLSIAAPLEVTTETLPQGKLDLIYNVRLEASGGIGFRDWQMVGGTLPDGISLSTFSSKDGSLTGRPTEVGEFTFTAEVTDSSTTPLVATKEFTLMVDDLIIAGGIPVGVINHPYDELLVPLGGIPPYTWTLHSSSPPGLEFDAPSGRIFGIPTELGLTVLDLELTDSSSPPLVDRRIRGIHINPPPEVVNKFNAPKPGFVDISYSDALGVRWGRKPYSASLVSGALPDGLTIDLSATTLGDDVYPIQGIPTTLGDFSFTIGVEDSSKPPIMGTKSLTLQIIEPLEITTPSTPDGSVGEAYLALFEANGGIPPYRWNVLSEIPQGLFFDSTAAAIVGTPLAAFDGTLKIRVEYTFRNLGPNVHIVDATQKEFSMTIADAVSIATSLLPPAKTNAPFDVSLVTVGGVPPYSWSVQTGSLPAGLTLDPLDGRLHGTPTVDGTFSFTIKAIDSSLAPLSGTRDYTLEVSSTLGRNDSILTATPLSNGTYSAAITPYSDPVPFTNPDSDYFQVSALAGTIVNLEIVAAGLSVPSQLDSVMELLASDGTRFTTCRDSGNDLSSGPLLGDTTAALFDDDCVNDDTDFGTTLDSRLEFLVPGNPGDEVMLFVHVLDFRGDARPDFGYRIVVSGVR